MIEDPELRRGTSRELNKGESRNSLARAVFIHRLGEIRDPPTKKHVNLTGDCVWSPADPSDGKP